MNPRWDESEFVFCDLQTAARRIRRDNPRAARASRETAYAPFEFLARNPSLGRTRGDFGSPEVRSWRVDGFRRYLISIANCRIEFKSGGYCTGPETIKANCFPEA